MNRLSPKAERKAAFLSFVGLAVFVALVCAIQLPTHHHLPPLQYLADVALATTFGALAGAMLGYIRRLIGVFFDGAT